MSGIDALAQEFTAKVDAIQERVQLKTLPVERKVASCILKCYDQHKDYKSVHLAVEQCQSGIQEAQKAIQGEFESLQGSVQSCQQSYVQRLQPQFMSAQGNPSAEAALKAEFEVGVARCLREADDLLPGLESRIASLLKKHS